MSDDSISAVEATLLVEDVVATLRHRARNSLTAVRSAAYYIRRRVETTPLWGDDPRVAKFFQLIEEQLAESVEAFSTGAARLPHPRRLAVVAVEQPLRAAFAAAGVAAEVVGGTAYVDTDELTLAIERLVGFAQERGGAVAFTAEPIGDEYRVMARMRRGELPPGPPWHGPLALARRVALVSGGHFEAIDEDDELRVELWFSQHPPHEHDPSC